MPVNHDSRLAFTTIEPLTKLREVLSQPQSLESRVYQSVDISGTVQTIDKLINDLKAITVAASGESAEEVQRALQAEGEKRSLGQQERQKRLAACEGKTAPSGNAGLGQARQPQVSNQPIPRPRPV